MMPQAKPPVDVEKAIGQIREFIAKHSSGVIVLPAKSTPDALAAGTSLYLALTKMGKNVSLVSATPVQSDMIGADKIVSELQTGGDNLVVSFPYVEGSIDKVDYNIQGEKFNLIIVPRQGKSKLSQEHVEFSYSGGKIDFIITVDAPSLQALGDVYQKNQRLFEGATIINIDRHLINNSYGMINLIAKSSSSTSELVFKVIESLGSEMTPDIATNLHAGLVAATNNFSSYSVNADTFDVAAALLRKGAVKKPYQPQFQGGAPGQFVRGQQGMGGAMGGFGGFGAPSYRDDFSSEYSSPGMSMPQKAPMPVSPNQQQPMNTRGSMTQNQAQQGQFQPNQESFEKQAKSQSTIEKERGNAEGQVNEENPEDILKPKIFSGSGGLV